MRTMKKNRAFAPLIIAAIVITALFGFFLYQNGIFAFTPKVETQTSSMTVHLMAQPPVIYYPVFAPAKIKIS